MALIYSRLFNHSVAYEIRLQKAMEADLFSSFSLFGVTDVSFDGISIDEKSDFNKLVSQDRVRHIISKIEEYVTVIQEKCGVLSFARELKKHEELSAAFSKAIALYPLQWAVIQKTREDRL